MKLSAWLEDSKTKHGDFAARIGTSQAAVTRYAKGLRIPRPDQMAAIVRETSGAVTPGDFYASAPVEAA